MSLVDALAIVSCVGAVTLLFVASLAAVAVAVLVPFFVAPLAALERDWGLLARASAWWVASLAALVLLIWIDGNVDPWWP